jgi:hypothetical protein
MFSGNDWSDFRTWGGENLLALFWLAGASCIWILIEPLKNTKLPWCMTITFWVYMVHGNIEKIFNKILGILLCRYGFVGVLINIIFGVVLTYLLAVFFAFLLKKYCNRAWKIVNGYR